MEKFKTGWQYLKVGYSFTEPDKRVLNADFRFWGDNSPHFDFKGLL
ncbi:MAG: hypothetical protein LBG19_08480 [Prevotellaceae bacterium]|nr:hypothetical protein [Prevotellaceae bacterium]